MKRILPTLMFVHFIVCMHAQSPIVIDHTCTHLYQIPASWIASARSDLHIAYGHSSHGSQLISGMIGLYIQYGSSFSFNNGGSGGVLDLHDYFAGVGFDLGYPDFYKWDTLTRAFLESPANANVNVVIWSWCGQLSYVSEEYVNIYLGLMNQLELDFPGVIFVYMTGHLDGTGVAGNLNARNEQIRAYCVENNKILYDFADIESYAPDGDVNYMGLLADDNCDYDSDNNSSRDANWAVQWCNTHPDSCFYTGDCAHSQALNCQQKGIAAWWLWARLAGWAGPASPIQVTSINVTCAGGTAAITTKGGTLQLNAEITPANATNKTVTWSMTNGTGQATINTTGLVTAVDNGTVTAAATANDGSGISGSLVIDISNQETPNGPEKYSSDEQPLIMLTESKLEVRFNAYSSCRTIQLYNLLGKTIFNRSAADNALILNISSLPAGLYILVMSDNIYQSAIKIEKP